jgi:hypothetical protein
MNPFAVIIARKKAGGGGGGGGAIFVSDTFTDTNGINLTAHTGETGATWAKVTGVTGDFKIYNNKTKGDSGGTSLYYASGTPDTNEYDVEVDLHQITSNDYPGIGGRIDAAADDGYWVWLQFDAATWSLVKRVGGTETVLGSYVQGFSNGSDHTLKLEIRTAAKKFFLDGVERISDSDNSITGVGKAGVRSANSDAGLSTTGRPFDNFTATNA